MLRILAIAPNEGLALSIREISRTLGISDVAVKTRLSRSRKQLRLLLADEQGGVYGSI